VIPGETGWIVPASALDQLVSALEACLDAPEEVLRAMGENGRARVLQRHDVDREAAALAALYKAAGSRVEPALFPQPAAARTG